MSEFVQGVPDSNPYPEEEHIGFTASPGDHCPRCLIGIMDYDGLLILTCPVCGYSEGGCYT